MGGGRKETTIAIESHTEVVEMEGDPEELARAASTVQASFRGHKARQEVAKMRADAASNASADVNESDVMFEGTDEEHGAAVKLQSTFRGHVARREVAADRARAEETELTNAATKVQAGFRGHLARKQVAGMKGGDA